MVDKPSCFAKVAALLDLFVSEGVVPKKMENVDVVLMQERTSVIIETVKRKKLMFYLLDRYGGRIRIQSLSGVLDRWNMYVYDALDGLCTLGHITDKERIAFRRYLREWDIAREERRKLEGLQALAAQLGYRLVKKED